MLLVGPTSGISVIHVSVFVGHPSGWLLTESSSSVIFGMKGMQGYARIFRDDLSTRDSFLDLIYFVGGSINNVLLEIIVFLLGSFNLIDLWVSRAP